MAVHKSHRISNLRDKIAGFTLIEMLIVIVIISVVSLVTAPLGIQFYNDQTIIGMQGGLGDTFTRARSQSVVQKNDNNYGVCILNSGSSTIQYVLYTGVAGIPCSGHNAPTDEVYPLLTNTLITLPLVAPYTSSTTEINFAKHTGTPTATGTITIAWNGFVKTLTIDSLGSIVEK